MAILTDLPNELVREVVRGSEEEDLVGFSRISAGFRTESQAELFYFPILHSLNAARFLASLESDLELPMLVKRLKLINTQGSVSAETWSKLLYLVTELKTLKCHHIEFDCRWLLLSPKLHSLGLDGGTVGWSSTESFSFPSIKNLCLKRITFKNIQSSQQLPLLFPSVATLSIQCGPDYDIIQPFGQHTTHLYLYSSSVDLESIKLLQNLEIFHSCIPFPVFCDVLPLLSSSLKQVRIQGCGSEEEWSTLVKFFESNLDSFEQLETVYISSSTSIVSEVADLRNVLQKRKIRLEVLQGYVMKVTFEDWLKLVDRRQRN